MSQFRDNRKLKYARCNNGGYDYIRRDEYYKVLRVGSDRLYIIDRDGDENDYGDSNFGSIMSTKYGQKDHVLVNGSKKLNKITEVRIDRTNGPQYKVGRIDEFGSYATKWVKGSDLEYAEPCDAVKGDSVICIYNNMITSDNNLPLSYGVTYEVLDRKDTSDDGVMLKVKNKNGEILWYTATRFKKVKSLPKTKNSAEAQKETINMTATTTKKGTMMDKFGVFGEVSNVALTFNGKLAFLGEDGCYYSYENGVLVNNEDMVLDGFPMFAMPTPRNTIKQGDLIIQKDGTYLFVNSKNKFVNEKGEVITTTTSKHALFGNAMDFVSKVMDFGGFGLNEGTASNPFGNPMVMAMMMGKDGGNNGNMMETMMMVGMMQNMNGNADNANPMQNMMLPMMFMGKDGSSGKNDMMRNMFMMQMFNNQQKTDK